jgi:hypothetical protein
LGLGFGILPFEKFERNLAHQIQSLNLLTLIDSNSFAYQQPMYNSDNQQTLKNRLPPNPRQMSSKQPIFIEDPIGEENSSASDSTSLYSNPTNYSTVKKSAASSSYVFNRDIKFVPKFFDFPLAEKRYKVSQNSKNSPLELRDRLLCQVSNPFRLHPLPDLTQARQKPLPVQQKALFLNRHQTNR